MAKPKKKSSLVKKILILLIIFILGVIGIVVGVFMASISKLKKNADKITEGITEDYFRQIETSIIYDIDGNEITSLSGIKELYYVEDKDIPEVLKDAFFVLIFNVIQFLDTTQ